MAEAAQADEDAPENEVALRREMTRAEFDSAVLRFQGLDRADAERHYRLPDDRLLTIYRSADCPWPSLTSYSTSGASRIEMRKDGAVLPFRVEVVAASSNEDLDLSETLNAAVQKLTERGVWLAPGIVLPEICAATQASELLPHLYFTYPFSWSRDPPQVTVDGLQVGVLQAIALSESEFRYAIERGAARLEKRLEAAGAVLEDFRRESTI